MGSVRFIVYGNTEKGEDKQNNIWAFNVGNPYIVWL